MKIERYAPDRKSVAILERLAGCGGSADFWMCRVYELARFGEHYGRMFIDGACYGDIAYRKSGKEEKNHKDAYKLINDLFPEVAGLGLKAGGYACFTLEEMKPKISLL